MLRPSILLLSLVVLAPAFATVDPIFTVFYSNRIKIEQKTDEDLLAILTTDPERLWATDHNGIFIIEWLVTLERNQLLLKLLQDYPSIKDRAGTLNFKHVFRYLTSLSPGNE